MSHLRQWLRLRVIYAEAPFLKFSGPDTAADLIKVWEAAMHSPPIPRLRVRRVLSDAADLLALVWLIPFTILLLGAPFALVGAGLVWLARLVRAAS